MTREEEFELAEAQRAAAIAAVRREAHREFLATSPPPSDEEAAS